MSLFNVRADLFRAVAHAVSTEETRYYPNGVFIEPCAQGGVVLVATDGHWMLSAHDTSGTATRPLIVNLPKDVLAAGKAGKKDTDFRRFIADNLTAVDVFDGELVRVTYRHDWEIEGTFPDWRRVTPSKPTVSGTPSFSAKLLACVSKVAAEVSRGEGHPLYIVHNDDGPAVVRFSGRPELLCLLMPMRGDGKTETPEFAKKPAPQQVAA